MSKDNRTSKTAYPAEMRNQLWPLCCGAQILSGFKSVGTETHEELVAKINDLTTSYIADHQVYAGEVMMPTVCFLTLNGGQMASPKIVAAVEEAGFKLFGLGTDRGSGQGFFVRNKSGAFRIIEDTAVPTIKAASGSIGAVKALKGVKVTKAKPAEGAKVAAPEVSAAA